MYDALVDRKQDLVESLHQRADLLQPLYSLGGQPGSFIVGIKTAVAQLGICTARCAGEFDPLDVAQQAEVSGILASLDLASR